MCGWCRLAGRSTRPSLFILEHHSLDFNVSERVVVSNCCLGVPRPSGELIGRFKGVRLLQIRSSACLGRHKVFEHRALGLVRVQQYPAGLVLPAR